MTSQELNKEEAAVLKELKEKQLIQIPSRKSNFFTEELRQKGNILKRLVYQNKVCYDFYVARPDDETSATCLVYWLPQEGKTPMESYK